MANKNEALIRKGYEAFAKGDMDTIRELFAEDILWHAGGRGSLSGTYKGRDEVFGFLAEIVKRSEGTFAVEVHDIVANDRHVVALTKSTATAAGKTYNDTGTGVYHIENGKVTEAWFNAGDQYAQDEFWG